MKHIKLFEDFHHPTKFKPQTNDSILNEICAELRKAGYNKAYYGEKKDGEMFLSIDPNNVLFLFESKENKDHKQVYTFQHKDNTTWAKYTEGSRDVKDIVSIIKKII